MANSTYGDLVLKADLWFCIPLTLVCHLPTSEDPSNLNNTDCNEKNLYTRGVLSLMMSGITGWSPGPLQPQMRMCVRERGGGSAHLGVHTLGGHFKWQTSQQHVADFSF